MLPARHAGCTIAFMAERERLLDMMRRLHARGAWHGPSVTEALAGVDHRLAAARPLDGGHTIWEIALHIAAWRSEVRARIGGRRPGTPDQGDWQQVKDTSAAAWQATRDALDASYDALSTTVRNLSDADLDRPLGTDENPSGGSTIGLTVHGIIQHDAYHAGQISLLKKSRGRPS
jgi:uncharacterized damage-inducible protein DinB